jgi:hypothetical protein
MDDVGLRAGLSAPESLQVTVEVEASTGMAGIAAIAFRTIPIMR